MQKGLEDLVFDISSCHDRLAQIMVEEEVGTEDRISALELQMKAGYEHLDSCLQTNSKEKSLLPHLFKRTAQYDNLLFWMVGESLNPHVMLAICKQPKVMAVLPEILQQKSSKEKQTLIEQLLGDVVKNTTNPEQSAKYLQVLLECCDPKDIKAVTERKGLMGLVASIADSTEEFDNAIKLIEACVDGAHIRPMGSYLTQYAESYKIGLSDETADVLTRIELLAHNLLDKHKKGKDKQTLSVELESFIGAFISAKLYFVQDMVSSKASLKSLEKLDIDSALRMLDKLSCLDDRSLAKDLSQLLSNVELPPEALSDMVNNAIAENQERISLLKSSLSLKKLDGLSNDLYSALVCKVIIAFGSDELMQSNQKAIECLKSIGSILGNTASAEADMEWAEKFLGKIAADVLFSGDINLIKGCCCLCDKVLPKDSRKNSPFDLCVEYVLQSQSKNRYGADGFVRDLLSNLIDKVDFDDESQIKEFIAFVQDGFYEAPGAGHYSRSFAMHLKSLLFSRKAFAKVFHAFEGELVESSVLAQMRIESDDMEILVQQDNFTDLVYILYRTCPRDISGNFLADNQHNQHNRHNHYFPLSELINGRIKLRGGKLRSQLDYLLSLDNIKINKCLMDFHLLNKGDNLSENGWTVLSKMVDPDSKADVSFGKGDGIAQDVTYDQLKPVGNSAHAQLADILEKMVADKNINALQSSFTLSSLTDVLQSAKDVVKGCLSSADTAILKVLAVKLEHLAGDANNIVHVEALDCLLHILSDILPNGQYDAEKRDILYSIANFHRKNEGLSETIQKEAISDCLAKLVLSGNREGVEDFIKAFHWGIDQKIFDDACVLAQNNGFLDVMVGLRHVLVDMRSQNLLRSVLQPDNGFQFSPINFYVPDNASIKQKSSDLDPVQARRDMMKGTYHDMRKVVCASGYAPLGDLGAFMQIMTKGNVSMFDNMLKDYEGKVSVLRSEQGHDIRTLVAAFGSPDFFDVVDAKWGQEVDELPRPVKGGKADVMNDAFSKLGNPFHFAIEAKNKAMLQYFVDKDFASINSVDGDSNNPLSLAIINRDLDCINTILNGFHSEQSPSSKSKKLLNSLLLSNNVNGESALQLAMSSDDDCYEVLVDFLTQVDIGYLESICIEKGLGNALYKIASNASTKTVNNLLKLVETIELRLSLSSNSLVQKEGINLIGLSGDKSGNNWFAALLSNADSIQFIRLLEHLKSSNPKPKEDLLAIMIQEVCANPKIDLIFVFDLIKVFHPDLDSVGARKKFCELSCSYQDIQGRNIFHQFFRKLDHVSDSGAPDYELLAHISRRVTCFATTIISIDAEPNDIYHDIMSLFSLLDAVDNSGVTPFERVFDLCAQLDDIEPAESMKQYLKSVISCSRSDLLESMVCEFGLVGENPCLRNVIRKHPQLLDVFSHASSSVLGLGSLFPWFAFRKSSNGIQFSGLVNQASLIQLTGDLMQGLAVVNNWFDTIEYDFSKVAELAKPSDSKFVSDTIHFICAPFLCPKGVGQLQFDNQAWEWNDYVSGKSKRADLLAIANDRHVPISVIKLIVGKFMFCANASDEKMHVMDLVIDKFPGFILSMADITYSFYDLFPEDKDLVSNINLLFNKALFVVQEEGNGELKKKIKQKLIFKHPELDVTKHLVQAMNSDEVYQYFLSCCESNNLDKAHLAGLEGTKHSFMHMFGSDCLKIYKKRLMPILQNRAGKFDEFFQVLEDRMSLSGDDQVSIDNCYSNFISCIIEFGNSDMLFSFIEHRVNLRKRFFLGDVSKKTLNMLKNIVSVNPDRYKCFLDVLDHELPNDFLNDIRVLKNTIEAQHVILDKGADSSSARALKAHQHLRQYVNSKNGFSNKWLQAKKAGFSSDNGAEMIGMLDVALDPNDPLTPMEDFIIRKKVDFAHVLEHTQRANMCLVEPSGGKSALMMVLDAFINKPDDNVKDIIAKLLTDNIGGLRDAEIAEIESRSLSQPELQFLHEIILEHKLLKPKMEEQLLNFVNSAKNSSKFNVDALRNKLSSLIANCKDATTKRTTQSILNHVLCDVFKGLICDCFDCFADNRNDSDIRRLKQIIEVFVDAEGIKDALSLCDAKGDNMLHYICNKAALTNSPSASDITDYLFTLLAENPHYKGMLSMHNRKAETPIHHLIRLPFPFGSHLSDVFDEQLLLVDNVSLLREAAKYGKQSWLDFLTAPEAGRSFVGLDVNTCDAFGEIPLFGVDSTSGLNMMFASGARVGLCDSDGRNILHRHLADFISGRGALDSGFMRKLVFSGIDLDQKDHFNITSRKMIEEIHRNSGEARDNYNKMILRVKGYLGSSPTNTKDQSLLAAMESEDYKTIADLIVGHLTADESKQFLIWQKSGVLDITVPLSEQESLMQNMIDGLEERNRFEGLVAKQSKIKGVDVSFDGGHIVLMQNASSVSKKVNVSKLFDRIEKSADQWEDQNYSRFSVLIRKFSRFFGLSSGNETRDPKLQYLFRPSSVSLSIPSENGETNNFYSVQKIGSKRNYVVQEGYITLDLKGKSESNGIRINIRADGEISFAKRRWTDWLSLKKPPTAANLKEIRSYCRGLEDVFIGGVTLFQAVQDQRWLRVVTVPDDGTIDLEEDPVRSTDRAKSVDLIPKTKDLDEEVSSSDGDSGVDISDESASKVGVGQKPGDNTVQMHFAAKQEDLYQDEEDIGSAQDFEWISNDVDLKLFSQRILLELAICHDEDISFKHVLSRVRSIALFDEKHIGEIFGVLCADKPNQTCSHLAAFIFDVFNKKSSGGLQVHNFDLLMRKFNKLLSVSVAKDDLREKFNYVDSLCTACDQTGTDLCESNLAKNPAILDELTSLGSSLSMADDDCLLSCRSSIDSQKIYDYFLECQQEVRDNVKLVVAFLVDKHNGDAGCFYSELLGQIKIWDSAGAANTSSRSSSAVDHRLIELMKLYDTIGNKTVVNEDLSSLLNYMSSNKDHSKSISPVVGSSAIALSSDDIIGASGVSLYK